MINRTTTFIFSLFLLAITTSNVLADRGQLQIGIIKRAEECPRQIKNGDTVYVHYEGSLLDKTVFDDSYSRAEPFQVTVGAGMVIKGWDKGLLGMCQGEIRKLVIPSDLAYGDRGAPPDIPPKATLKFKVELVRFVDESQDDEL